MQPILQHLFQASSLETISREQLESFVREYPSFGIGHYLLSRKLKAEGSDQFAAETQKTSLYFTNPFWLQWQLDHVAMSGGHVEQAAAPAFAAEPEVAPAPVVEEPVRPEEPPVAAEHVIAEEPAAAETVAETAPEAPVYASVVAVAEESYDLPSGDNLAEALTSAPPEESSAADQLLRSIEEAKAVRDSLQKINTDFESETAIAGETLPAEPAVAEAPLMEERAVEEPAVEERTAAEPIATVEAPILDEEVPFVLDESAKPAPESEPILDEEAPFVLDEPEAVAPSEPAMSPAPEPAAQMPVAEHAAAPTPEAAPAPTPVAEHAVAPAPAAAPMPEPAAKPVAEAAATPAIPTLPGQPVDTGLIFEPFHTVDYFASQGIKLSLDDNPKDKLGKQLKSFTEWLKGMRRLPQKDREVVPDRVAEEAIQNIAAHSIEGKEVMTETMADVLAMQGMRERAKAVYEKLSLLNPEKRAYFAAKIEQLNIP
jgi:hypothetical protein